MQLSHHQSVARIAAMVVALGIVSTVLSQNASPELAALLNKLPADSPAIRVELLKLDGAAIRSLCGILVEPGSADDNKARFALHGLAIAVADPGRTTERLRFVNTLGEVLHADSPPRDGAFVIQQLELAGGREAIDVLSRALLQERWCDAAARALLTIGGQDVTTVFLGALPAARGRARITVITALGDLNDQTSVSAMLKDAAGDQRELRLAALYGLARSGDPRAADALLKATQAGSWYEQSRATDLLLVYGARLAETQRADEAARICRDLLATRNSPGDTHVRCAALHGLAAALGPAVIGDVLAALADENPQVRAAAGNVAAVMPGEEATRGFIAGMAEATPTGRAAILAVLERRGDKTGLPAALKALDDAGEEVALSAVHAVAALGGDEAVNPLIVKLADAAPTVRDAVRDVLVRIPGQRATELVGTGIKSASSTTTIVTLLDVLAARPPTGKLEPIFSALEQSDPEVRVAALRALGVLGDEATFPTLLDLLLKAAGDDERDVAEQAVTAVGRRCADREKAASLAIAALSGHEQPARVSLLHVLGRLGGNLALKTVQDALDETTAGIREAAIRALGDWPDAEPVALALDLATTTEQTKEHVLALRAYIRMVGLDKDQAATDTLALYLAALDAARRPDEKKLVLGRLADVKEPESLKMLEPYLKDEVLRAETAAAMVSIVEAFIPARWPEARRPLEVVLAADIPDEVRQRAEKAMKKLEKFEDYIADWWVAGPYQQEQKAGHELFDETFPPEQPTAEGIAWRKQPVGQAPESGWLVDLHTTMRGPDRAGYLFTRVFSPQEQEAQLQLGSDDGIKVWLNGEVVHSNNALRGCVPADDKVKVALKSGWNTLLLKVTNDSGGWDACARFRAPDGTHLDGLRAEAGEKP